MLMNRKCKRKTLAKLMELNLSLVIANFYCTIFVLIMQTLKVPLENFKEESFWKLLGKLWLWQADQLLFKYSLNDFVHFSYELADKVTRACKRLQSTMLQNLCKSLNSQKLLTQSSKASVDERTFILLQHHEWIN
jgi:hypothetical protein